MEGEWTFGKKIAAGFALIVLVSAAFGVVAIFALTDVRDRKDRVIHKNAQLLIDAHQLEAAIMRKSAAVRGYLLTKETKMVDELRAAGAEFDRVLAEARSNASSEEDRRTLDAIDRAEEEYQHSLDGVIAAATADPSAGAAAAAFQKYAVPAREAVDERLGTFMAAEHKLLESELAAADFAASREIALLIAIFAALVLIAVFIAVMLTRSLTRQIGSAVGQVRSSSTELQAAANQQATGAREQHTAMNEISTTISELLATSRQISDSASRVAQIAEETTRAARSGEGTVDRGQESSGGMRRQVDQIVNQMSELGKKSQQIGSVLDIVSELAEQTNILAINASIEAAGAGESGKRFNVVADEIRKLADRVGGSTKEIRTLIDDVRGTVNAAVMTTETGSKAVDAGAKQFADVAGAFKRIAGLVDTTTEAAKEIQLSTKQQTTAVEQVNLAIANVAQATKENEASSAQTLATASQLAGLSRALLKLVQPEGI